jgi:hypothetical protein
MHMIEQPFRQAAALLLVLWLLAPTAAAAGSPHYTVVTDERLEHLDVTACRGARVQCTVLQYDLQPILVQSIRGALVAGG